MDVIYSIGHSSRDIDDFIVSLQQHGITMVADVRRHPVSRFEHFSRDELMDALQRHGIGYAHLEALGAFRDEGYETWMTGAAWLQGYERLVALARRHTTAFMCAERLPQRCHRRFIARRLARDGWRVVHLIDRDAMQATLTP